MPERKALLLRLDPATLDALRAWAADELRSLNGQIEFVLRRALREAGRLPSPRATAAPDTPAGREPSARTDALGDVRPGRAGRREQRATAQRDRAPALAEER